MRESGENGGSLTAEPTYVTENLEYCSSGTSSGEIGGVMKDGERGEDCREVGERGGGV